eukprot:g7987.t1
MKTYSRRNSRPISRSSKKATGSSPLLSPSTPSCARQHTHIPGNACGNSGAGSTSTSRIPIGREADLPNQQTPSSSSAAAAVAGGGEEEEEEEEEEAPASAEAVSVDQKRRRQSLSHVPVCSLGRLSSPSSTPSASSSSAGAFGRRSSGGTGGSSDGGSTSVLGVRALWGADDSLRVGRKRRRPGVVKTIPTASSVHKRQQQGASSLTKRSEGGTGGGGGGTRGASSRGGGKGAEQAQTFLDFGQRSLGQRILCPRCNLLYVCGSADDEARHAALCAKTARGVDFAGWKQERVKARFADDGGRVVEIRHGDPAAHLAKLREVESLMDADMGFAPGARDETVSMVAGGGGGGGRDGPGGDARCGAGLEGVGLGSATTTTKKKQAVNAFLYIRERRVLGCVVAERIESARRAVLLPSPGADRPTRALASGARMGGAAANGREAKAAAAPHVFSFFSSTSPNVVSSIPLRGNDPGGPLSAALGHGAVAGVAAEDSESAATESVEAGGSDADVREGRGGAAAVASAASEHATRRRGGEAPGADNASAAPAGKLPPPLSVGLLTPSRAGNAVPPPLVTQGVGSGDARPAASAGARAGAGAPAPALETSKKLPKTGVVGGASGSSSNVAGDAAALSSSGRPSRHRAPKNGVGGARKASGTTTLERFWLARGGEEPSSVARPPSAAAASCISSSSPAAAAVAAVAADAAADDTDVATSVAAVSPAAETKPFSRAIPEAFGGGKGGREGTGIEELRGGGACAAQGGARAAVTRLEGSRSSRNDAQATSAWNHPSCDGSDCQDLRAWSAGVASTSAAAGGAGERDARAAVGDAGTDCSGNETQVPEGDHLCSSGGGGGTSGSDMNTRSPAMVHLCGTGAGNSGRCGTPAVEGGMPDSEGLRPVSEASAGAEENGGGGGPLTPVSSSVQATALAAKAKATFVRASPWSLVPVAAAPAVGVAAVVAKPTARESSPAPRSVGRDAALVEVGSARSQQENVASAAGSTEIALEKGAGGGSPRDINAGGGAEAGSTMQSGNSHPPDDDGDATTEAVRVGADCHKPLEPAAPKREDDPVPNTPRNGGGSGAGDASLSASGTSAGEGERREGEVPPTPPRRSPATERRRRRRRRSRWESMESGGSVDSEVASPPENDPRGEPPSLLTCDEKQTPAVVGILQVWVHQRYRRQGVATRLVDAVRERMVYGISLRRDQMAFSQPTREGQAFATRYTWGKLLVY